MMASHWGAGWMGFGGISMVLFWLVLIVAVVLTIRYLRSESRPGQARLDDAERVLAERYARGEIGTEEFRRARRELDE